MAQPATPPDQTVYFVLGDPKDTPPEECPICGFDAILHFPLWRLVDDGVSAVADFTACGHCYQEAKRQARLPRSGD